MPVLIIFTRWYGEAYRGVPLRPGRTGRSPPDVHTIATATTSRIANGQITLRCEFMHPFGRPSRIARVRMR